MPTSRMCRRFVKHRLRPGSSSLFLDRHAPRDALVTPQYSSLVADKPRGSSSRNLGLCLKACTDSWQATLLLERLHLLGCNLLYSFRCHRQVPSPRHMWTVTRQDRLSVSLSRLGCPIAYDMSLERKNPSVALFLVFSDSSPNQRNMAKGLLSSKHSGSPRVPR